MKKTIAMVILLATMSILLSGCDDRANTSSTKGYQLSAWTTYWDYKNVPNEINILGDNLTEIVYFGAYFDQSNHLFIPKETQRTFQEIKNMPDSLRYKNYLAIVNDKVNSKGKTSLKSRDLLYELFANEKSVDQHINDIVNLACEGGYDGVEIDYEAIKGTDLWHMYLNFTSRLYQKLKEHNLKMRIDLESSAPINKLKFPEGPEYVMMCYNLYGADSKPGPKADKKFLQAMADKMAALPGKKSLAIATGGFDWSENGKVEDITEQEADSLLKKYSIIPQRDSEKSNALTFKYSDQSGLKHQVWFADGLTLSSWITTIKNKGDFYISLWRLNGNNKDSLKLLSNS
ncbi:glycosyl hydrolase family 18 protein [Desulfosporosinus sp. SYSU MS00001]|uniref:glycosyl hydrolase family 18 protein n=1 Tax=Desulfosporosinus sp. SYSU MS00001 TaxID=3416284 RepID=UPI003CF8DA16